MSSAARQNTRNDEKEIVRSVFTANLLACRKQLGRILLTGAAWATER